MKRAYKKPTIKVRVILYDSYPLCESKEDLVIGGETTGAVGAKSHMPVDTSPEEQEDGFLPLQSPTLWDE